MGAWSIFENKFLWKSAERGNAGTFWKFLTQIRQHYGEEKVAIIADNVSFHNCKYIENRLDNYKKTRLFNLPTYSPEYNPVEQVWHWIKPMVHGSSVIYGGSDELIARFRRIVYHWRTGRIYEPLKVGNGIWATLL